MHTSADRSPAPPRPGLSRPALHRLLTALYVTQYLGIGFLFIGLTAILRDQGVSLEQLGAVQALGLVWALKFAWSPLVDRFGSARLGHYRGWLLLWQPLMVITLLAMAFIEPSERTLPQLLPLVALFVLFSATQDIAADGIAVRLVPVSERGIANGIQIASGYLGNIIGGGLTVIVYDYFGWAPAMLLLAAMTAVALVVVVTFPERRVDPRDGRTTLVDSYRALWSIFAVPGAKAWAFVVVPLFYVGVSIGYTLLTPALVDLGWSLTRIGFVTGVVGGIPSVVGAVLGGWSISRWGRSRTIVLSGVLTVVSALMLLPLFAGSTGDLLGITAICLYLGGYSAASSVIFTVNMDYSRPESAGSDYTVLGSIAMVCSFLVGALALTLAGSVGYVPVVLGSTVMVGVGTVIALRHLAGHEGGLERAGGGVTEPVG